MLIIVLSCRFLPLQPHISAKVGNPLAITRVLKHTLTTYFIFAISAPVAAAIGGEELKPREPDVDVGEKCSVSKFKFCS